MNRIQLQGWIDKVWDESILDCLKAYIRIPNQLPQFDPQWQRHGLRVEERGVTSDRGTVPYST